MVSAVDICNLSLGILGEDGAVTSINPPDGSIYAAQCSRFYPLALERLLESGAWGFATKQKPLVRMAKTSDGRPRFEPPADCIRILSVTEQGHRREQRAIDYETEYDTEHRRPVLKMDARSPVVAYVSSTAGHTPALFPAYFTECLILLLAIYLYGAVKRADQTSQTCQALKKQYESELAGALKLDANASCHIKPRDRMPSGIAARMI